MTLAAGLLVGRYVAPTWTVEKINLDVAEDSDGRLSYVFKGEPLYIDDAAPIHTSPLNEARIRAANASGAAPDLDEQYVWEERLVDGRPTKLYYQLVAKCHWGFWSLLPAAVAVGPLLDDPRAAVLASSAGSWSARFCWGTTTSPTPCW